MDERVIKVDNKTPRISSSLLVESGIKSYKLLCLSDRAIWLIRLFVSHFRHWDTLVGLFVSPKLFQLASSETLLIYRETIEEILGAIDMSCDLTEGLNSIAEAISGLSFPATNVTQTNNNNCSGGYCGAAGVEQVRPHPGQNPGIRNSVTQDSGEVVPIIGEQPRVTLPESGFPEGFANVEEYQLDRCQLANLIFDNAMDTLYNLATIGVFDFGAVVGLIIVSVVGLVVFPPSVVPLLAMWLGVLAVNVAVLLQVRSEIISRREEWVCWLYEGETVEWIVTQIADALDEIIALIPTSNAYGVAIKAIVLAILNGDTLNQLYKKQAHSEYPGADCSGCGGCEDYKLDLSTYQSLQEFPPLSYTANGVTTVTQNGETLVIDNPAGGTAVTLLRWQFTDAGSNPLTSIILSQLTRQSGLYLAVFVENNAGEFIFIGQSDGYGGTQYYTTFNFTPMEVRGIFVYYNNSQGIGLHFDLQGITLFCEEQ